MTEPARFHLVRSFPVEPTVYARATRCQGTRCGRIIEPGEVVHLVQRAADFSRDPDDSTGRAYLCSPCADAIPDLEVLEHHPVKDLGPAMYRGKEVPAF